MKRATIRKLKIWYSRMQDHPMHVHFKQDETLTIVKGKLGIQYLVGTQTILGEGETITFKAGEAHRFRNAGTEPMICKASCT